jgi:hypothetical protein
MSTVFEELNQLQANREAAFGRIVDDLVAGRDVDAQVVDQLCRDVGKSPSELASLVSDRKRKQAKEDDLAREPGLVAERAELQKQIEEANTELESRVAAHQATCMPLQQRTGDINQELTRLAMVRTELAAGVY